MNTPAPGRSETVEDGLRRILAPNPGPMTYWGTNTFILGEGRVAIIDPGPEDMAHLHAIDTAVRGETVTHILVTHAHRDHSPLARLLSRRTGAPILGFGPPEAGRSPTMTALAATGLAGGGEGIDVAFAPDIALADGDLVDGDGWQVRAIHTPGHFAGHLAFEVGDIAISGDHVMEWSSSLVSPPDGDLSAFMTTCAFLRDAGHRRLLPGHGARIDDPADRLDWLVRHRKAREVQILNALGPSPRSAAALAERIYRDIPAAMLPAAERNVFAHLVDLHGRGLIKALPRLAADARFTLI